MRSDFSFNSSANSMKSNGEKNVSTLELEFVFTSHSFWTSMDVPAGVTQEEGHTGFLIHLLSAVRALVFLARRIQPFLSLVDREVEFCSLFLFILFSVVEKAMLRNPRGQGLMRVAQDD